MPYDGRKPAEVRGQAYDDVAPDASAMIESMRAYGYTLATAIADLIDNSIAATATSVWIDSHWAGADSWISITDNGRGMSDDELRDAMRLGSRNPLLERSPRDLGRFGLGLKTASLSQCRRLTVVSRARSGETHVRRWDLDHLARRDVSGWQLLRTPHPASTASLERLEGLGHGTAVLWEVLDRLVADADARDERTRSHFLRLIDDVERHLAMVFHRYLRTPRPQLQILVNGHALDAWDPFLESHPATLPSPEERILLPDHDLPIVVRGFVLPHKDRLEEGLHELASGPAGWNAQQGFYLYRNDRLIVPGRWLGLGGSRPWTQEEHYKLARISLDVPNSMDHLWQLDVKKSHATPPSLVRERLIGLAQNVRQRARSVFVHRGRYRGGTTRRDFRRAWKSSRRRERTLYLIDRRHPLVEAVLDRSEPARRKEVEAMLRILEETVPVQQIWLDAAEKADDASAPFQNAETSEIRHIIHVFHAAIMRNRETTHKEAVQILRDAEEFSDEESQAILTALEEGGAEG